MFMFKVKARGVHDLRMDGVYRPILRKASLFQLPKLAIILTLTMNFEGENSALAENFSENVCLHKENVVVFTIFEERENIFDFSILFITIPSKNVRLHYLHTSTGQELLFIALMKTGKVLEDKDFQQGFRKKFYIFKNQRTLGGEYSLQGLYCN